MLPKETLMAGLLNNIMKSWAILKEEKFLYLLSNN